MKRKPRNTLYALRVKSYGLPLTGFYLSIKDARKEMAESTAYFPDKLEILKMTWRVVK